MAVRALTALLMLPFTVHALERMDETAMSDVVAQEGVRLISEYEATIDSAQYFDESPDGGSITFSAINVATRARQIIDFDVISGADTKALTDAGYIPADRVGRNGLRFTNEELPINVSVDDIRINGRSIGKVGLTDFTTGGSPIFTDLWAGGDEGSGFTLDLYIPQESSFHTYYEDDGTRLSMNVDYCAERTVDGCQSGGLSLKGLSFDVVAEGLRVGLPEIAGGQVNIRDFSINDSRINDISFSNIVMPEGGYLITGAPDVVGESAVVADIYVASGTGFDFEFYDTSDDDVQVLTTQVRLSALGDDKLDPTKNFFRVNDVEMNVLADSDVEHGIRVDIGSVRGVVNANNIELRPADIDSAPVLGSAQLNLQLTTGTYVEIMGH